MTVETPTPITRITTTTILVWTRTMREVLEQTLSIIRKTYKDIAVHILTTNMNITMCHQYLQSALGLPPCECISDGHRSCLNNNIHTHAIKRNTYEQAGQCTKQQCKHDETQNRTQHVYRQEVIQSKPQTQENT